ncbi:hypothetical protein [Pendulispora brunnea]|uniref:aromatic-ring hydroxylase C-terminal domain-containing protein n=1 Tax=Pendulispora brunnea TaxID=2905690 RepID=UPI00374DFD01
MGSPGPRKPGASRQLRHGATACGHGDRRAGDHSRVPHGGARRTTRASACRAGARGLRLRGVRLSLRRFGFSAAAGPRLGRHTREPRAARVARRRRRAHVDDRSLRPQLRLACRRHRWKNAADALGAPLRAHVLSGWQSAYGVNEGGAVLVRPDGMVAARFTHMENDVERALARAFDMFRASA